MLTESQLCRLSTQRLLAYRNKLLQYPDSISTYHYVDGYFNWKKSPEWIETYALVKKILAERPHLETKPGPSRRTSGKVRS